MTPQEALADRHITVYENGEGDYWVRLDEAPTEAEARAAVEREWPGAYYELLGIETVPLSDYEWDDPKHPGPGRRRRAWHFYQS
jgi:hypothetical protein